MGREEAATIYLDRLLGFPGDYSKLQQAEETLTESDRVLLRGAVSGWIKDDLGGKRRGK
jgi:hypothetical protein